MENLIAYIPVINRQYVEWLGRHRGNHLYLISHRLASKLLPRLERNLIALDANLAASFFVQHGFVSKVTILNGCDETILGDHFVVPDEDLLERFVSKYLSPSQTVKYETIWGRWDMKAVIAQQPIIADIEVTSAEFEIANMSLLREVTSRSPDWWRQVCAAAYLDDQLIAMAVNTHGPTEYEVMIHGDPAINREAGVNTKISLALHAEQGIIAQCADLGISTRGAILKVTTFPCADCARLIAASGFSKVIFEEGYSNLGAQETLKASGVQLVRLLSKKN